MWKNLSKEEILEEIYFSDKIMSWDRVDIANHLQKELQYEAIHSSIKQFVDSHNVNDIMDYINNNYEVN